MKTLRFLFPLAFFLCLANAISAQTTISDTDSDTQVETERVPDEDIIWFSTGGVDRARLLNSRLEFLNTGRSVFIGTNAGASDNLTNNENVFIGSDVGASNTNGAGNVGLGRNALNANTVGLGNMGIGPSALRSNTTGNYNAAIGNASLLSNTTGVRNAGIGFSALRFTTTGGNNVGIGSQSGYFNTIGNNNICIGTQANYFNEEGLNNVIIGYQAGRGTASHNKSNNIFIGNQAGYNEIGSNRLYIENSNSSTPLIYGEFENDRVTINDRLGVNGLAPTGTAFYVEDIDGSRTANIVHNSIGSGNDVIELEVQPGAPDNASFIEFEQGTSVVANIRTDGSGEFKDLIVDGKASASNDGNIIVEETSTGFSRVTMRDATGNDYWDIAARTNDTTASQMRFWYSNQDGNSANIMNIDGIEHKVGVNTTSPAAFLQVETESYSSSPGIVSNVNFSSSSDVRAVQGTSVTNPGFGIGVEGTGGYMGIRGNGNASTYTGTAYGVYGTSTASTAGNRYGIFGNAAGGTTGIRYGVNGNASGGTTGYGTRGYASGSGDRYGSYGQSSNTSGTGYGAYGEAIGGTSGTRYGLYGKSSGGSVGYGIRAEADGTANGTRYAAYFKAENGTSGTRYGVYAQSEDGSTGYGVYGRALAVGSATGTRYGVRGYALGGSTSGSAFAVYGSASVPSGSSGEAWGGYFPTKSYTTELRVGTTAGATGYRLMVNGKAIVEEMKVQDSGSWPDYVFADEYDLKPLAEVEAFIKENKHLPNIPSAAEICEEDGFMVGEMQNKTLEKVEELTLYMIDANKRIEELEKQNQELQDAVRALLEQK